MRPEAARILAEQIARSRMAVAASRATIVRSLNRIDESHHIVVNFRAGFLPPSSVPDEERGEIDIRWEASIEQRQIDREIRQSVRDGVAVPTIRRPELSNG